MSQCIVCLEPTRDEPVEHIVPESLLGDITFDTKSPQGVIIPGRRLVLVNDEVCRRCNSNVLSPLDQHFQAQLGILKVFWNAKGTKKGAPATMRRPGASAVRTPYGAHITLNSEAHVVFGPDGIAVPPAGTSIDAVRAVESNEAAASDQIRFTQPMRVNKRFIRAMHKIALELLCFEFGPKYVLHDRFNWLRDYVLGSRGSRVIGMAGSASLATRMPPFELHLKGVPASEDWILQLTLGFPFLVDLTHDNRVALQSDPEELRESGLILWADSNGGQQFTAA